jgi:hypothetical protein
MLVLPLLICQFDVYAVPADEVYHRVVTFNGASVVHEVGCVTITPSMQSENYFEGLQRRRTPRGPQFRKGATVFDVFPDKVILTFGVTVFACHTWRVQTGKTDVSLPEAKDLASKTRLQVAWKRGMVSRPVAERSALIISQKPAEETLPPFKIIGGPNEPVPTITWAYCAEIDSHGVPLTDHLTVTVLTDPSTALVRFSFGLDTNDRELRAP